MRFAIVGCGLIGQKRAQNRGPGHSVVVCADPVVQRAEALAAKYPGAAACADWSEAVRRPDVDAVVVSTTHDNLAKVSLGAVEAGKHVLVEKPAARSAEELVPVIDAARRKSVCVHVGFNHRFHPALSKAKEMVEAGDVGPIMFIRARYGHGGRVGYEKEWRAKREQSGGGELVDQGVHLIDLSRWFMGDFAHASGHVPTYFWKMDVEDNAFMLLRKETGEAAWLHATWTEWKNTFSFEIMGRVGKLQIDGLGGSYGTERLTFYRMKPEMGPPESVSWEFPGADVSWAAEGAAFVGSASSGAPPRTGLKDAKAVLDIVGRIYKGQNQ